MENITIKKYSLQELKKASERQEILFKIEKITFKSIEGLKELVKDMTTQKIEWVYEVLSAGYEWDRAIEIVNACGGNYQIFTELMYLQNGKSL